MSVFRPGNRIVSVVTSTLFVDSPDSKGATTIAGVGAAKTPKPANIATMLMIEYATSSLAIILLE